MKRLIFALICILLATSVVYGQSRAQQRKARQAAQQAQYDAMITSAIDNQSFTFTAENMSQNFGQQYPINGAYTTVVVMPSQFNVRLPYLSSTQPTAVTPLAIDFSTSSYKYSYSERAGMFYVKITVNNVINNQANNKIQNGRYVFEFEISPVTGNAFLTVTPAYNASITYTGIISPTR